MDLARELEVATRLALAAGEVVRRHYAAGTTVDYKGPGRSDPVTAADRDANALIVRGLAAAFPDDALLAEESPLSATRHEHARLWCIDPVDGTQEFIAKNGEFAVMIGLAIDGAARLGVVYQPTADALYCGAGTYAACICAGREQRLAVSRNGDMRRAVLMVSRSHRSQAVSAAAARLGVAREQPSGSVGLKMVRIAEGTADLYLSASTRTHEWDACAPEAILRAAGGRVSDVLGAPLCYNKPESNTPFGIVASNTILHDATIAALAPLARERGWMA